MNNQFILTETLVPNTIKIQFIDGEDPSVKKNPCWEIDVKDQTQMFHLLTLIKYVNEKIEDVRNKK